MSQHTSNRCGASTSIWQAHTPRHAPCLCMPFRAVCGGAVRKNWTTIRPTCCSQAGKSAAAKVSNSSSPRTGPPKQLLSSSPRTGPPKQLLSSSPRTGPLTQLLGISPRSPYKSRHECGSQATKSGSKHMLKKRRGYLEINMFW